jgi:phage baseplate assembly protein gpV
MSPAQYDVHAPTFSLRIAGGAAEDALAASLAGWRVSQQLSKPAMCELTFHDLEVGARRVLRLGADCELTDANGTAIFTGSITAMRREKRSDGFRALVVRAHDALDRLRRRQAMVVREPGGLARIVARVVADLGFDVDADDDGPELPLSVQWGANDLDWIGNLCASYGKYFYLQGRTLKLMSLNGGRGSAIELDINESLFDAWVESSAIGLRTEATACAWNPLKVVAYRRSAIDLTLDAVPEWESAPEELKSASRDIVGGAGPLDEGAVSCVAEADLERAGKRAHCFGGLADGDARFAPGTRVALTGVDDDEARQEFALTSVEHAYTPDAGFTSLLSSEPPADPVRLQGPAISYAVVSDTNDPASAGRVRTRLKAFNDAESDWLNVLSIGAGENKGFVSQPEEGDSVLIAFVNDNPAQGVVLGGLFGAHTLHDEDVRNNRPRPASLRTRDGQSLRLDDQAGAIKLKSRGGVFELDPNGVLLQSTADLKIAAPGKRITIVADKIDFQKG